MQHPPSRYWMLSLQDRFLSVLCKQTNVDAKEFCRSTQSAWNKCIFYLSPSIQEVLCLTIGIKLSALFNKWQSNSLGTVMPRLDGWGSLWHLAAPADSDKRTWIPAEHKHAEPTWSRAKNVNIYIEWHVRTIKLRLLWLNLQRSITCCTCGVY